MARELRDVIDHLLPRPEDDPGPRALRSSGPDERRDRRPAALPLLALPIGDDDVVRAAFAWNLTVEVARLGGSAALVAPYPLEPSPAWPRAGRGPLGAEALFTRARGLGELHRAALDVAVTRAADAADGGLVLVRVPPTWLLRAVDGHALLRWSLLFTSTESRELLETYALAKRILALGPDSRIGVTVHGARRLAEAERAFAHVADVARRHLRHAPISYGLLVDDLHVYRAIVARRPIGLEKPQSPAARALRDVARLLLGDARRESHG